MSTDLIPLTQSNINGEEQQTVNARDLHKALGVPTKFTSWILRRIDEFGFLENQDFTIFSQKWEKTSRGRPTTDYFLTLGMAKELCMVERNAVGKKFRLYFIECEKIARQKMQPAQLSREQILQMALDAEKERLALEQKNQALEVQIEEDLPKVLFAEEVAKAADDYTVTHVATLLKQKRKDIFAWLQQVNAIYRNHEGDWEATQYAIQRGRLVMRAVSYTSKEGKTRVHRYLFVRPKGILWIHDALRRAGQPVPKQLKLQIGM